MSVEDNHSHSATGSSSTASSGNDEEVLLLARLRAQVEFYFSPQNLSRDVFLRSQFYGTSCPSAVICQFPKVRELTSGKNPIYWIHKSLVNSSVIQMSPDGQWLCAIQPLPPLEQSPQHRSPNPTNDSRSPSPSVAPAPSPPPPQQQPPPAQQRVILNTPMQGPPPFAPAAVPYQHHPMYAPPLPPYMYAARPHFYHHPPPRPPPPHPQTMGFTYMNAVGHRNYFGPNYTPRISTPPTNNHNNNNNNNSNATNRSKNQSYSNNNKNNSIPRSNNNNRSTTANDSNSSISTKNNNSNKTSTKKQRMKQRNNSSSSSSNKTSKAIKDQQQQSQPTKDMILGTDHFPALPSSAQVATSNKGTTKAGYADALRQPNSDMQVKKEPETKNEDDVKNSTVGNNASTSLDDTKIDAVVEHDDVDEVEEGIEGMISNCHISNHNSNHSSYSCPIQSTSDATLSEPETTNTTTIAVGALTGTKTKTEIKQQQSQGKVQQEVDKQEGESLQVAVPIVNIINHSEPTPKEAADGTKNDQTNNINNHTVSNTWGNKPSFIDVVRKQV